MDAEKKDNIINIAANFFNKLGFKKTSIDEIAQACGVAKGTIYLAAKSKQDLFYQVLLRQTRLRVNELKLMIDPSEPADEMLIKVNEKAFNNFKTYPLLRDLLFGKFQSMLPSLAHKLEGIRQIALEPAKEILEIGIKQGRFREDLDIETTADILMDLHQATMLFHLDKSMTVKNWSTRREAMMRMVFDGIKA